MKKTIITSIFRFLHNTHLYKNWLKLIIALTPLFLSFSLSKAQILLKYEIEAQTIGTTNKTVPFWMRSNQFGSVPLPGLSQSFIGKAYKSYNDQLFDSTHNTKKLTDWGFGFEGRGNVGGKSNFQLIEAYAKMKFWIFQLKGGRTRDVMGLNGDTILSSGNFAVSGNALGIPKIEISIPNYWRIPLFDGLFSIKGNFAHGWVGKAKILDSIPFETSDHKHIVYQIYDTRPETYYHQKSLYGRIGKPDWKLQFYAGFSHQVYWGNGKEAYGSNYSLSPLETFIYVALGKAYGAEGIPRSKIGNQLGSIDIGASYEFKDFTVVLYRQNFYDVGALSKLANIKDGLNGITMTNKNKPKNSFKWKKILAELFYSKDQAGYPWSKLTASGNENYYNNYYYLDGWSYKTKGLGNPLITTNHDAKPGQATRYGNYFLNDRVVAIHLGLDADFHSWNFILKTTYSWNYGTFGSSTYGDSLGFLRSPQTENLFVPVQQFSFYSEGMRQLERGLQLGFSAALDKGQLLNNSTGLMLKIKKKFN